MKKTILIALMGVTFFSCNEGDQSVNNQDVPEQKPIEEVSAMIDSLYFVDQDIQLKITDAAQNGESEKLEELFLEETTIFERHIPMLKDIYEKIGYPTIDLVGKDVSSKFFTLVQHADADVTFQKAMLEEISKEVNKGNVSGKDYAFLTDRVQIALQGTQIFGTQLNYNMSTGQAYPKELEDSSTVNQRRKDIGLETLEEYLNQGTIMHFEMNKNGYLKELGITEPQLYELKK